MFKDRRHTTERRSQSLPIPQPLDRRMTGGRRLRNFESKPWWLSIDYCEELAGKSASRESTNIAQPKSGDPLLKS